MWLTVSHKDCAHTHTHIQLIGLALIGGGIYLIVAGSSLDFFTGNRVLSGAAIIIICGVVTAVVSGIGLLGACGLWRVLLGIVSETHVYVVYTQSHTHTYAPTNVHLHMCTHTTPHTQYAVAVLLIVLLEIVAGILGFVYRDTLVSCYHANVAQRRLDIACCHT